MVENENVCEDLISPSLSEIKELHGDKLADVIPSLRFVFEEPTEDNLREAFDSVYLDLKIMIAKHGRLVREELELSCELESLMEENERLKKRLKELENKE